MQKYRLKKRYYFPDGEYAEPQELEYSEEDKKFKVFFDLMTMVPLTGKLILSKREFDKLLVENDTEFFEKVGEVENPVTRLGKGWLYSVVDTARPYLIEKWVEQYTKVNDEYYRVGNYFKTQEKAEEALFLFRFVCFLLHFGWTPEVFVRSIQEGLYAKGAEYFLPEREVFGLNPLPRRVQDEIKKAVKLAEDATDYKIGGIHHDI